MTDKRMTLAEAIAAIQAGNRVRSSAGTVFWLAADTKGRPVLTGQTASMPRPVRHVIFGSEHFDHNLVWEIVHDH